MCWLIFLGQRYASLAGSAVVGYEGCVASPLSCEGQDIRMSIWTVTEVGGDRYTLRKVGAPVPVIGDPAGLAVGDRVSVVGRYDPRERAVVEVERVVHRLRRAKEILSAIGLIAVLVMIPAAYTWRDGRVLRRG